MTLRHVPIKYLFSESMIGHLHKTIPELKQQNIWNLTCDSPYESFPLLSPCNSSPLTRFHCLSEFLCFWLQKGSYYLTNMSISGGIISVILSDNYKNNLHQLGKKKRSIFIRSSFEGFSCPKRFCCSHRSCVMIASRGDLLEWIQNIWEA